MQKWMTGKGYFNAQVAYAIAWRNGAGESAEAVKSMPAQIYKLAPAWTDGIENAHTAYATVVRLHFPPRHRRGNRPPRA